MTPLGSLVDPEVYCKKAMSLRSTGVVVVVAIVDDDFGFFLSSVVIHFKFSGQEAMGRLNRVKESLTPILDHAWIWINGRQYYKNNKTSIWSQHAARWFQAPAFYVPANFFM